MESRVFAIGDFRHWKTLGTGSGGEVSSCEDAIAKKKVAIKRMVTRRVGKRCCDEEFLKEVELLQKLTHQNVVPFIGSFRTHRNGYIVMEFLDSDLHSYIKKNGGMQFEDVKDKGRQILLGLNFCHENNVIHRDLKPENILINSAGVVKLADFGMARSMTIRSGEKLTLEVVTPNYKAPEVIAAKGDYGFAIDMWAYGCIFAEMVSGAELFPYAGDVEILRHIIDLLGSPKQKDLNRLFKSLDITTDGCASTTFLKKIPKLESNPLALNVLEAVLKYSPSDRPTAGELLDFEFFKQDGLTQAKNSIDKFITCV